MMDLQSKNFINYETINELIFELFNLIIIYDLKKKTHT